MSAVPAGFVGMGYVGVMGTNHDMYFDIHLIAGLVAGWPVPVTAGSLHLEIASSYTI